MMLKSFSLCMEAGFLNGQVMRIAFFYVKLKPEHHVFRQQGLSDFSDVRKVWMDTAYLPRINHQLMKGKLIAFSIGLCCSTLMAFAQEKSKIKFGNISPADFAPSAYAVDSSASAVIIADIGSTEIIGNNKGSFSLLFKTSDGPAF